MKRITVLLIIAVAFLGACSTTRWNRQAVAENRDFIVSLEQQEAEDRIIDQKYDHPYAINLQDLEKLMADLTYTEKVGLLGKKKQLPVFQAVEIKRLAPIMADSLAKADDSQRIRFTSYNQAKALIFSVSRETEGVLFVESGGQLNFAFCFINSEIDPTETTTYPAGFSRTDPLRIKSSGITIIPTAPYAERYLFDDGEQAPMWVVADLEKLHQAVVTAPVPQVEIRKDAVPAEAETEPEARIAPAAPAAAPVTAAPVMETEKPAPVPTSEDMLQQDIKKKLKYLKELLDEGLISEQDYNAKKLELLEKID